MKKFILIAMGIIVAGSAFAKSDRKPSSEGLKGANADILMSLLHGQKFATCVKAASKDGEPSDKITCVVKGLSCTASSEGYGLGSGFAVVKNAGCYSKALKKSISKDLATGIAAVLRAANTGETGPDGYDKDDKLRRDMDITEITCVSHLENQADNSCELKLNFDN